MQVDVDPFAQLSAGAVRLLAAMPAHEPSPHGLFVAPPTRSTGGGWPQQVKKDHRSFLVAASEGGVD